MATPAEVLRLREAAINQEIDGSVDAFDLRSPLTEDELVYAGLLGVLPGLEAKRAQAPAPEMPLLQEIEDVDPLPVDAVEALADRGSYNEQYVHYMKCQALAALVAFTEGWSALEDVLKFYVRQAKRENEEYRGTDPNKAFSLRVKQQTAEDFLKFIRRSINEAVVTPKPVLASK
jgi:hypothetical protein